MKRLIQLSMVAATLAMLGGCGGSSDPQTLTGVTTDSAAILHSLLFRLVSKVLCQGQVL